MSEHSFSHIGVQRYTSQCMTKPTIRQVCVTNKDSDQPLHPPSMSRVLILLSLDSLKAVKGTCDRQRL